MPVTNSIDYLECPVCTEQFKGRVFMCMKGHSVCETCRNQLETCPMCQDIFPGTRNYVVEQLSQNTRKVEEMQLQMENVTAHLQKENSPEEPAEPDLLSAIGPQNYKKNLFAGPLQAKGFFRCLFPQCDKLLPICRFLNHIRQLHTANLIEEKLFIEEFHGSFEVIAKEPVAVKVYNLSKFGIIFLFLTQNSLPNGSHSVNAWVQCVAPNNAANKLRYSIKLLIGYQTVSYSSVVYGSRKRADTFRQLGHCLKYDAPSKVHTYKGQLSLKYNRGPAFHNRRTVIA